MMTRVTKDTDMRRDLQAERSVRLFKVTTCGGRAHIVAAALQTTQLIGDLYTFDYSYCCFVVTV